MSYYFPELLLINSLHEYSLCEKYYNQLVANNYFFEHLEKTDSSSHVEENEIELSWLLIITKTSNKKKEDLLLILQQVKDLYNEVEEMI